MKENKIERIHNLVSNIKDGYKINESFDELFDYFVPLVKSFEKVYHLEQFDDDDWVQEASIVCYKACNSFNSEQGSSFPSYFKFLLKNRVITIIRSEESDKRKSNKEKVYIEDNGEFELGIERISVVEDIDFKNELSKVLNQLNPQQLLYLKNCFDGNFDDSNFSYYTKQKVKKIIRRLIKDIYG